MPFVVTILDDDVPEPVEFVEVQVVCAADENCYSPRSFYTITIVDDQGGNQTILCVCVYACVHVCFSKLAKTVANHQSTYDN